MDASLEDRIIVSLRRIVRAVDLHSRRLIHDHGVTGPQVAVLRALRDLGPLASSVLAREVQLSPPTVTGIVSRLADRGLVVRGRSEADRRQVQVAVTEQGRGLLAGSPSLLQDQFLVRLAALEDWERTALLSSLQRLAAMMDAENLEAGPHLVPGPDIAPPVADRVETPSLADLAASSLSAPPSDDAL